MNFFKPVAAIALGAALSASTALTTFAAETTLVISSWAPPTHGMNAMMWPKLIKMIEEATDGRVTAQIKYKLGSPPAQFDLVQDGAADISWIFHGYNPGRFVATQLIELPGYEGSAEAASVTYWRAYEKFLKSADEHKGVKLIALHTHGPGQLHSATKVTKLDQIKGMKLRLGGGVSGAVGDALGATGIRVPAPKVYETLASNAADGVMMPMEGKKGFKLTEVAQHSYTMPGGFYRGSFASIMNQEKFDSLSKADQDALMTVFGEPASRMAGQVWDQIDTIGVDATNSTADNSLNSASDADQKAYGEIAKPIIEATISAVTAKGIDAKAAIEFIAKDMAAN
ncbi:TRAP transporter substrate-binding protein [Pelagibius sp. Alg239-R121]|uniref:TRAP transporter substrate-binding protein n=1 Tax=Pelagibius sp. Alg239-R121 TaxID=2993448 RepID=UPI0024A73F44|nr:TRAP transporter substrate-binding protein [Pelagibius sp. Alg239-R121]